MKLPRCEIKQNLAGRIREMSEVCEHGNGEVTENGNSEGLGRLLSAFLCGSAITALNGS